MKREFNKLIAKYKKPITNEKIRQVISNNNKITDGFVYESGQILFSTSLSTNGKIDPLSASISNISTQPISSSELLELDKSLIESGVNMTLRNALSRKRKQIISPKGKHYNRI